MLITISSESRLPSPESPLRLFPNVRDRYERFKSDSLRVVNGDARDVEAQARPAYEVESAPCSTEVVAPGPIQDKEPDKSEVKQSPRHDEASSLEEPQKPATYYPPDAEPFNPRIDRGGR